MLFRGNAVFNAWQQCSTYLKRKSSVAPLEYPYLFGVGTLDWNALGVGAGEDGYPLVAGLAGDVNAQRAALQVDVVQSRVVSFAFFREEVVA